MIGKIVLLDTGVSVLLADWRRGSTGDRVDGWYRGIIVHSANEHYRVGGSDLSINDSDVERGRELILTDDIVEAMADGAPVIGATPTIESIFGHLRSAAS